MGMERMGCELTGSSTSRRNPNAQVEMCAAVTDSV